MPSDSSLDAEFWRRRWATNQIGFHESAANPRLVAHLKDLAIPAGARVFLPLCGKTLSIGWLLRKGYRVAGAELSELAIAQLFDELRIAPDITDAGRLKRYRGTGIDIFVGDVFDLDRGALGPVDAIFDRAALTALPPKVLARYTQHLVEISAGAPQLLITYAYDQSQMDGPPFSTSEAEVRRFYRDFYEVGLLEEGELADGLRTASGVVEQVWLLKRLARRR